MANESEELKHYIRDIPEFPKPGITFKDISPLLAHGEAFKKAIELLVSPWCNAQVETVVGIESRGFLFGTPMAIKMGCGFVPVRKPGKLPAAVHRQKYQLEYGSDAVEIHRDALKSFQRVLVVDDLLATGGTMRATCELLGQLSVHVVGLSFLIELAFLNGRQDLGTHRIESVITY